MICGIWVLLFFAFFFNKKKMNHLGHLQQFVENCSLCKYQPHSYPSLQLFSLFFHSLSCLQTKQSHCHCVYPNVRLVLFSFFICSIEPYVTKSESAASVRKVEKKWQPDWKIYYKTNDNGNSNLACSIRTNTYALLMHVRSFSRYKYNPKQEQR